MALAAVARAGVVALDDHNRNACLGKPSQLRHCEIKQVRGRAGGIEEIAAMEDNIGMRLLQNPIDCPYQAEHQVGFALADRNLRTPGVIDHFLDPLASVAQVRVRKMHKLHTGTDSSALSRRRTVASDTPYRSAKNATHFPKWARSARTSSAGRRKAPAKASASASISPASVRYNTVPN